MCSKTGTAQEENSPEYLILIQKAQDFFDEKKFVESGLTYSKAFKLDPKGPHPLSRHNAAASYAMGGMQDSAFSQLNFLVKIRYPEYKKVAKDKRLKVLHGTARWDSVLAQLKRITLENEINYKKSLVKMKQDRKFHDSLIDKPTIPFSCTDINGKKWELATLQGKVVVLNFWATWCGPCKLEMPELNAVKEKFKGKEVVFIAFCDNVDSVAVLNKSLAKNPFTYEMVIGAEARKINQLYQVSSIPLNMVIDKKGKTVFLQDGYAPQVVSHMENKIEELLEK